MTRHHFLSGPARTAAAAAGVVLALSTLSACGGEAKKQDIAVIDVQPSSVASVTFTAAGRAATIRVEDGEWLPGPGATVQAATMLTASSDRYFPLNSYRIMEGLNLADPTYGLTGQQSPVPECRPECSLTVTNQAGRTWKLTIGALTFNGGFYGKLDGDPRMFLITKETVGGIIAEAIGKDFAFPASAKIRSIEEKLNETGKEKEKLPDYDPYLRQVLAAEEDEAAVEAGGTNPNKVLRAAGSTQDQPGAKDGKDVQSNSNALQPPGANR